MTISVGKAIVALLGVWLVVIFLMTGPLLHSSEGDEHITRRLTKAMNDLELLKRQNDELRSLLSDFKIVSDDSEKSKDQLLHKLQQKLNKANHSVEKKLPSITDKSCDPTKEFEVLRRKVITDITEMWYFMTYELKKLKSAIQDENTKSQVQQMLETGADYKRVLLHNMRNLSDIDGLAEWRKAEHEKLSNLIQDRLHKLQNPEDCSKAKKVVCNLNKGCGYGCQIHHAVYCLIIAYGTSRTLILKSKGWRYNKEGWETVFKPVSETCTDAQGRSHSVWPGSDDTQVIDLPIIDSISPRPPFLPLAIPKDISDRLIRLHDDPIVWWVSQFLKYLLRPQENLQKVINETTASLGFKKPIVGIHVRRTDKVGTEAAFHNIYEYMEHVKEFYRQLELHHPVPVKRVYIASDDPSVFEEAKKKFPTFTFVGDPSIAKSASVATRYSDASLKGIILDIHFLSSCDYLVCTFSSQVCRIAYEIMQSMNPDGANAFTSLDDIYYFGGQNAHNHRAIYSHTPMRPDEIALEPGDLIGIAGNHWNGFSKGVNRRTKQQGLYPSYKAINKIDVVEFP
uniref:Alpha-(1,6)-fucosyltransferase n=1 Tax=Hemiscolopendra marginata TaxID=943146 RepID=A0A646QIG9_9MYRI